MMTSEREVTQTPPPSEVSTRGRESVSDVDIDIPDEDEGFDTDLEEDSKLIK